ncbi:release factor glutamine methyltransferase [Rhodobium orientis]|uniref:Release factor glutamine methyltransferase n=1 Tax=Rhodobium orientis TaxID=34017 RepID=A0A327JFB7_9HYPH|nr:peptide chain release factor N(5)-glutamine methyltransferase [Rhodobium orientis]MBB4305581.1 release factor glutamine methyltransferase [Rhodobium orientis]MBK5948759.1 protein-(glutamine-N5) methyltransferase, release factor-specific [Rhodobium orientis]RAI25087.1 protein-(glutamine-N5) methyltransferase, release factor-specific [Rhodobium orientis]
MPDGPVRLGPLLRQVRDRLTEAGIAEAETDARLLVGAALDTPPLRLALEADRPVTRAECTRIEELISRRAAREPVGRILGTREFWGHAFRLSPDTLEPRPDTETVVEAALGFLDEVARRADPLRIADLGTGTGALLVTLLSECPQAMGVGTDVSVGALAMARRNADAAGVGDRAAFAAMNYGDALVPGLDLVVSNPPYIASGEIAGLDREVRDHDPSRALDGGADGLDAYRAIAADASRLLTPGGRLFVEIGSGQAADVAALFAQAGLDGLFVHRDLAGHDRVVAAQHPDCGKRTAGIQQNGN